MWLGLSYFVVVLHLAKEIFFRVYEQISAPFLTERVSVPQLPVVRSLWTLCFTLGWVCDGWCATEMGERWSLSESGTVAQKMEQQF